MDRKFSVLSLVSIFLVLWVFTSCADEKMQTFEQKSSYLIGYDMGRYIQESGVNLDIDAFVKAIQDQMAGKESALSEEEQSEVMNKLQQLRTEKMAKELEKNKKEGDDFLAENKKKDGIKVTESGLQYIVEKEGEGVKPKAEDIVKVHYVGTFIDGTEFDSSYSRNEPAEFPVNGVISGWTEALQLMSVGSKYKLFIPSDLAYGERGAGGAIPPNTALIFEVELLEIKSK